MSVPTDDEKRKIYAGARLYTHAEVEQRVAAAFVAAAQVIRSYGYRSSNWTTDDLAKKVESLTPESALRAVEQMIADAVKNETDCIYKWLAKKGMPGFIERLAARCEANRAKAEGGAK